MSGKAARDALSHPLVLRGAWLRLDAWYRGADLAPEPELSLWRLHPEAKLRQLGADLRAGTWAPSEWQQVPYPKKGARLRHYVLPTVEDQVAFMAHMVLLGPLFDSCVETFAFGNRWYRPLVWNRLLPFSAADPDAVDADTYTLYCDILLLLTALDGKEAILDALADYGAGVIPLEDRWAWRSRVHLPKEAWQQIDRAFRWTESPRVVPQDISEVLAKALEQWVPRPICQRGRRHGRVK